MKRAAALLALFLAVALPAPARAGAIGEFLDRLENDCVKVKKPKLVVVGFVPATDKLSTEQAARARDEIVNALAATGRVSFAPGAKIIPFKSLRELTERIDRGGGEAIIDAGYAADAAVFFDDPERLNDASVKFQLVGISAAGTCFAPGGPIPVTLAAPDIHDVDETMRKVAREMAEKAPDAKTVTVCPFQVDAGFSACASALDERFVNAIEQDWLDPLRGGQRVVLVNPGECPPADGLAAQGVFGRDRDGAAWISSSVRRADGALVAISPRQSVSAAALHCDPAIVPFLDWVESSASAHVEGARLRIAASRHPYAKGADLDLAISMPSPIALYCWVLDSDVTARVLLPVSGLGLDVASNTREIHYPRDFHLQDWPLDEPRENLVDCFAAPAKLPAETEARWLAAAPKLARPNARDIEYARDPLKREEVLRLLNAMRAVPGVVESTTRLVVK